jgi:integrase
MNDLTPRNNKATFVGKVSIDQNSNKFRLRFTYPKGKRNQLRMDGSWDEVARIARIIDRDIQLNDVDLSYVRYSSKHSIKYQTSITKEVKQKKLNLIDIWERYKELNKSRIAKTSQQYLWKDADRYLSKVVDRSLLELDQAHELLSYLLEVYAASTVATMFRSAINPAINAAFHAGLIDKNPFQKLKIPKPQKKPPEIFAPIEVQEILQAFYSDEFNSKYSRYKHSNYAHFVDILAQTFARPEEIIPLTYDDILYRNDSTYIRINKRYSKGHLLDSTKTDEIRLFKCNQKLTQLLESIPRVENENNLLLPSSSSGGYINYQRFRESNWRVVLEALVKSNRVEKYLSPYHLRHTGISLLVREGYDLKSISVRSGHDVQTLIKHYLASKDDIDLPSLY